MATAPKGTGVQGARSPAAREDKGNFYGIMVMQLTMFCFVTNDTFAKLVGDALATGQMIFLRGAIAVSFLAVVLILTRHYLNFRDALHPIVLIRALFEAISALCFLTALKNIPLANLTAIMLATPLVTTAAAALFMGEQVGARRWTAVGVGFIGVLAIVRPGLEGFSIYALFGLMAMLGASSRDLFSRKIPADHSLWVVTFTTMTVASIGGGLYGISEPWLPVQFDSFLFLTGSALFMTAAQYFMVIAMSNGEISVVSSFRYITMPIALIYGFLLWGEVPDSLTLAGIALILGSGIYTIYRERKVARSHIHPDDMGDVAARTEPMA